MARRRYQGVVELSRPLPYVYQARHRHAVQADHTRSPVVPYPAPLHHRHVHVRVRRTGWYQYRWNTPAPLLYGWHHPLELFQHLLHLLQQCLRRQSGSLRQGLFPPSRRAPEQHYQQPYPHAHPVADVCTHLRLLCVLRQVPIVAVMDVVISPSIHHDDWPPCHVLGTYHHVAHHQVPRPQHAHRLRCPAPDVRHPCHLPYELRPRRVSGLPEHQPSLPHLRGFQVQLSWCRHFLIRRTTL